MGLFNSFRSEKTVDRRWWVKPKAEMGDSVMENYKILKTQSHNQPGRYQAYMSLYMNRHIASDLADSYMKSQYDSTKYYYSRAKFNLIKLMIDTVHNRVAKMKPRARFLPQAGSNDIQVRAMHLERWSDAITDKTKLKRVGPLVFLDALLFGIGILKPYRVGKDIRVERIYPGEVFVDQVEAAYDNVRQLFHRKYVAREVVEYTYVDMRLEQGTISAQEATKLRKAISEASRCDAADGILNAHSLISDPIEVVECWHLPSGPGAKDGKRAVVVEGALLGCDDWHREEFPMCFVRWSHEPRGWYGIGLAEELYGVHVDVNSTIERIEEGMALNGSPYVMVEESSHVKKSNLANVPGIVMSYLNTPPIIQTVNTVPPEFLNYLQEQTNRARNIARITAVPNGHAMPSGLQTGAAVREYHDAEREDFAIVMEEYEDFYMSVVKEFVHLGKEIYEEDNSYSVVARADRNTVSQVNWKEVDMDDDMYVLQVHPASALPNSPAGRIDKALELVNSGMIDQTAGLEMMSIPDTESALDLATAETRNIGRMIDLMLNEGQPQVLEPFVDAQLALKRASAAYNKAVNNDVPELNMTLLRNFMQQANMVIQEQQALAQQRAMEQAQAVNPAGPPAIDAQGQNPLAITGAE